VLSADAAAAFGAVASRAAAGAVVAIAIAVTAHRARSLSTSGAFAAVLVGTVCSAAGAIWAVMVIAFFASSTALGRIRRDLRARRIGSIVAKGGPRDATQVFANGGTFAAAALGQLMLPSTSWLAVGAGALAAAAADTWATEIGSLAARPPRDIIRWQMVAPGTSGGVTLVGTMASVAGAGFIGGIAGLGGWPGSVVIATVVGGIAGGLGDSILGALLQVRRWCDRCESSTEQPVHVCGAATRISGGVRWIDNDTVNLISVLLGGAAAFIVYTTLAPRLR
jgi:uncharacterized protein (TIGR00297 family)